MHTVVETFEASVGAPPPHQLDEDLSKFVKEPDEGEQVIHKDQGAQLSNPDPPTDGATNEGGDDSSRCSRTVWFHYCQCYLVLTVLRLTTIILIFIFLQMCLFGARYVI